MKHAFLLPLLFFCFSASAQMDEEDVWAWGLKGGYANSTMVDLINTVLPLPKRPLERPYSKELWQNGYTASLFGHKRIPKQPFVLMFEGSVSRLGGGLKTNIGDTFHVENHFRYTYAGIAPVIHWHPALPDDAKDANAFSGFHLGIGINYGLILKEDITYDSHQPQFDPGVVQRMKIELKGKSYFSLLAGIGYEYFWEKANFGICFDARFSYGLGDAVQTLESTLYEETDVRSQALLITLGFIAPLQR